MVPGTEPVKDEYIVDIWHFTGALLAAVTLALTAAWVGSLFILGRNRRTK